MTPEQRDHQLDALITIAAKHTAQIEALARIAEKHTEPHDTVDARIEALLTAIATLEKQWQAYINTLPRH